MWAASSVCSVALAAEQAGGPMMDHAVTERLVALNRAFYERFAEDFAASRATPQPGYQKLLDWIPPDAYRVLDVGCGNARFANFLREQGRQIAYTGVDFSPSLLAEAPHHPEDTLLVRDLLSPDSLASLGRYKVIVCLSTLQHVPGHANRVRLMKEMASHLEQNGRLLLGNWQFLDSGRQRGKIRPWAEAGLRVEDVEPGDYLLSWQRGGYGLRYVASIDEAATSVLAAKSGLSVADQYRADGREGNLNLYTILEHDAQVRTFDR